MSWRCEICGKSFESRNRLFKHLRGECKKESSEGLSEHLKDPNDDQQLKKLKFIHEDDVTGERNINEKVWIYVVGGRLRGRTLSAVHRYNIQEDRWETDCPSMIQNRGSHGAICLNGRIYAIGGGGLSSNLSTCECFDGVQWSLISALNVSRHALAVTSIGDKIYAVGGWVDGTLCSGVVEVFDTSPTNQESEKLWSLLPSLNLPRRLHGVASYGTKLYVFGGSCDDPHWHTDTAELYDTATISQWSQLPSRLPSSGGVSAVSVYPFIYLFLHGKHVCRYDPETDTYTTLSALPVFDWHCFDAKGVSPPSEMISESFKGDSSQFEGLGIKEIYLIGGASNGKWGTFAYCYDIRSDSWKELRPMKQAKRRLACAVVREPLIGCVEERGTEASSSA